MRGFRRSIGLAALTVMLASTVPADPAATQGGGLDPYALYIVGITRQVDRAVEGERVRACAPHVESLPERFTHLRTPPAETARAIAVGLCQVMIVPGQEVDSYLDQLERMGVFAEAAPLASATARYAGSPGADPRGPSLLPPDFQRRPATEAPSISRRASTAPPPRALEPAAPHAAAAPARIDRRAAPAPEMLPVLEPARPEPARRPASAPAARLPESVRHAQALFHDGYEALRADRPDIAADYFAQGLALSPNNAPATFYLAAAYDRMGLYGDAAGLYERVIALEPAGEEARRARERLTPAPFAAGGPPRGVQPQSPWHPRHAPLWREPTALHVEPAAAPSMRDLFETSPGARYREATLEAREASRSLPAFADDPPYGLLRSMMEQRQVAGAAPARPRFEPVALGRRSPTGTVGTFLAQRDRPPAEPEAVERAPAAAPLMPPMPAAARAPAPPPRAAAPAPVPAPLAAPMIARRDPARRDPAPRVAPPPPVEQPAAPRPAAEPGPATRTLGPSVSMQRRAGTGTVATRMDGPGERLPEAVQRPPAPQPMPTAHGGGERVRLVYDDGSEYVGEARNGEPHGVGTMRYPDGTHYQGRFENGLRHGHGTLSLSGGMRYEGEFVEDRLHGVGTLVWADGARYEGSFDAGRRTGRGTYVWPDGQRYEGEFVDGAMQGRGTVYFPDGRSATGVWRNGRLESTS